MADSERKGIDSKIQLTGTNESSQVDNYVEHKQRQHHQQQPLPTINENEEERWDGQSARCLCYCFGKCLKLCPLCWLCYLQKVDQHERLVVYRLGKVSKNSKGPGLFCFEPCVDEWKRVDIRVQTLDVPAQQIMTADAVSCNVNAVVYFKVVDPVRSVVEVVDVYSSTANLSQAMLRSVIGENNLDVLLQKREIICGRLTELLDEATDPWGVKVVTVEIKDVRLPDNMQRAMSREAQAERTKRAKVIASQGEVEAAENLAKAANIMTASQGALQLRYLEQMGQIASEQNTTIVVPLPMEFLRAFSEGFGRNNMPPPHHNMDN